MTKDSYPGYMEGGGNLLRKRKIIYYDEGFGNDMIIPF